MKFTIKGIVVTFVIFNEEDFNVFENRKRMKARYNTERKLVREKMKEIETQLTPLLENRGVVLNAKVSLSSIHPIYRKSVHGIWIAYSISLKRYFETPQLNCGIYENEFFVGIEIPRKSRKAQIEFVEICARMPELIEMVSKKLQTSFGTFVLYLHGTITNSLLQILEELVSKPYWISIGVSIPKDNTILNSAELLSFLLEVLETLYPLYLFISGIKSIADLDLFEEEDEKTVEYAAKLTTKSQELQIRA